MGGAPFWFWLTLVLLVAGIGVIGYFAIRRGVSRAKILAIASLVLVLGMFFIPVQAVQANGIYIVALLALAWAGYFVWRMMEKGWSSPPSMSQQERVLMAFKASNPDNQMLAAIPATVIENPSLPQSRRVTRGMLILTAQYVQVDGPRVAKPLQVPASDIAAMPVVASQEREAPGAPSVIIASKSGSFQWVAISETGQEGAELIAKWGERLYA